jgi:ubiquinone/menaquinone biosynthesis C-methylase UbiE
MGASADALDGAEEDGVAMTTTTITATSVPSTTVDLAGVKAKQQQTWSSGDYAVIGTTLQLVGELLCEAVDVSAGARVLDVAAGNGNASLAAARRGCDVTATDYVGELLAGAAARAAAEGLRLEVQEADVEDLPYDEATFDVVLSTFGAMFAPDPQRTASELRRVCRPGGRIGLANWTPDGFVGQMFKIVGRYAPPPAGVRSPLEWGTVARLQELFDGDRVEAPVRQFVFRYRSAQAWLDTFRTFYGPTLKAFTAVDADPETRAAFERDLLGLAESCNTATDGTLRVPSDYLEVVITRSTDIRSIQSITGNHRSS